jgi:hypothetical protein
MDGSNGQPGEPKDGALVKTAAGPAATLEFDLAALDDDQ